MWLLYKNYSNYLTQFPFSHHSLSILVSILYLFYIDLVFCDWAGVCDIRDQSRPSERETGTRIHFIVNSGHIQMCSECCITKNFISNRSCMRLICILPLIGWRECIFVIAINFITLFLLMRHLQSEQLRQKIVPLLDVKV